MPLERLREQFMPDTHTFFPLGGRNQESAKPRPKATPEVISIASTASNTSKAPTSDGAVAAPRARVRPILISSDEEEEEEKPVKEAPGIPIPIPSNKVFPRPVWINPANVGNDRTNQLQPQPQQRLVGAMPQTGNLGTVEFNIDDDKDDPNDFMTQAGAEKALKDLIAGNMNEEAEVEIDPSDKIVEGFKEEFKLLDHQVVGRKWMAGREDAEAKRYSGILADDMGLGKTIQILARILDNPARKSDREDGWAASTLVVCPLALVGQWADEVKRMTKLSVLKHQGTSRTSDPMVFRKHHVVVTTYDTVKSEYAAFNPAAKDESKSSKSKSKLTTSQDNSDSDEAEHFGRTVARSSAPKRKTTVKSALFQVRWFRIVLDEAHNIKNHNTKGAIAACELQGKYKWCLTGTPIQNNVNELYSLFKFLKIRPWNQLERFNAQFGKPIQTGRNAGSAMKRLQIVLKQIMLRRRKEDTLNGKKLIELPKRTVEIISCPFDRSEQAFYESLETKMDDALEKLMGQNGGSKYMSVLLLLLRLRQACNHPLLVTKDFKKDLEAVEPQAAKKNTGGTDADDLVSAFEQLGVTRKCQMCTNELRSSNTGEGKWSAYCLACAPLAEKAEIAERERPTSAKIRMILKLLRQIDERSEGKEKTIIFSQFTSMLDLIEPFLREERIRFVRYDGSMAPVDREAALSKIKSSPDVRVILISFKAGSTGLNLTACNNVILVDLWWNPALEDQAFDRAHRFGQTRDVNIFKLKIDNTVEERILLLQDKKRALAQAALSGDKLKNMRLGMEDLLALFRPSVRDESEDEDEFE